VVPLRSNHQRILFTAFISARDNIQLKRNFVNLTAVTGYLTIKISGDIVYLEEETINRGYFI
jgi:hypothetical protein